jgi:hypothetical protein
VARLSLLRDPRLSGPISQWGWLFQYFPFLQPQKHVNRLTRHEVIASQDTGKHLVFAGKHEITIFNQPHPLSEYNIFIHAVFKLISGWQIEEGSSSFHIIIFYTQNNIISANANFARNIHFYIALVKLFYN